MNNARKFKVGDIVEIIKDNTFDQVFKEYTGTIIEMNITNITGGDILIDFSSDPNFAKINPEFKKRLHEGWRK